MQLMFYIQKINKDINFITNDGLYLETLLMEISGKLKYF